MQLAIIALAASVTLFGVHQSKAWLLSDSTVDYDAINHMLVANVPSDDIEANMAMAKKAYQKRSGVMKTAYLKALEKFVALESIASPDKCNKAGRELLLSIDRSTNKQAWQKDPIRRVDKILLYYMVKHAQFCYNVYPRLIEEKKKNIKEDNLQYVDRMAKSVRGQWNVASECNLLNPNLESSIFDRFPIRTVINDVGKGDPDLKYLNPVPNQERGVLELDESKLKVLFNKYFYEPCKEFNDQVGEDLFKPMKYDYDFLLAHYPRTGCENMIWDRLAMGICYRLVHEKDLRKSVFQRLLLKW